MSCLNKKNALVFAVIFTSTAGLQSHAAWKGGDEGRKSSSYRQQTAVTEQQVDQPSPDSSEKSGTAWRGGDEGRHPVSDKQQSTVTGDQPTPPNSTTTSGGPWQGGDEGRK